MEVIEASTIPSSSQPAAGTSQITVEVAGSVAKPGVYTLATGSRVQDALLAAGNITTTVDTVYVEKNINKAAKVADGQKNRYGHPSPEIIQMLEDHHLKVFRTDTDGEIEIKTDGVRIWAKK